jgi:hypothetical protein
MLLVISLLAAAATITMAAAHRHITDPDIAISPLTVPQLDSAHAAARAAGHPADELFRRHKHGKNGVVADMHHAHAFVGATDKGFVDISYEAILKGESVVTDDYGGFFKSASARCTPMLNDFSQAAPEGTKPSTDENGIVSRNNVRLELNMSAAHARKHADAVAHLQARLEQGGALAFGVDLLATHHHFAKGAACAIQVPFTAPYFTIATFSNKAVPGGAIHWTVDLVPTGALSLFRMHSANISIVPNAAAELERRAAAGEPLGEDVRTDAGRRLAVTLDRSLGSFNLNYDETTKKAQTENIDIIPGAPGALTCNNCYAYYSGNIKVSLLACLDYYYSCSSSACDVARDTTSTTGVPMTTLPSGNDCAALGTIGAKTTAYGSTPSSNTFNMGFKASGQVTGAAGFSFHLTSKGIAAQTSLASSIMASKTLPIITVSVSGIPVTVIPTVSLATTGQASGAITGAMEFGASADLTVALGAEVDMPSVWDAAGAFTTPKTTAFKTIDFRYGTIPFTLTKVTAAADVVLNVVPEVILAVYNAIPIQIDPAMGMKVNLAMGSGRRLRSVHVPEYSAAATRSLVACSANTVAFSASTGGTLGIKVKTITANNLANGLNTAILAGVIPSSILSPVTGTVLAPTDVVPAGTVVKTDTTLVAAACSAVGGSATPSVIGATPPAGGDSSTSSSSCGTGCIIGVVVGSILGVALIGAGAAFFMGKLDSILPASMLRVKPAADAKAAPELKVRVPATAEAVTVVKPAIAGK